ncbi:Eukaryotic aspartyl protease family protein isoform 1 [Dorcoceras hygrometricum]|uniref:Eukaryotic aspartyl protease family protein isoform 1 n=1 Tax=Dorcoceras hygrometricum TaxID=472368 RepID=A0A2Z7ARD1_9LAMI|nr:Eukaryotic aspartyl protease family protein isoform 1 [Dorcoceras hygrometricum]
MERRRLTLNNVSAIALNSRCNQLLQASSRKLQYIQSPATVQPVESYSIKTAAFELTCRWVIQTQATVIQSQALQDQRLVYQLQAQTFKWYRYHQRLDNHSQAPLPSYCNEGELAVARSVVMKKRQQLSEQLLNKLLEHIQLLECNQRSSWKESMAAIESCKCLKSRGQDLYYSRK